MTFGGHRQEDRHWVYTLSSLASCFGVQDEEVVVETVCVDKRREWSRVSNVWHNAGIRSAIYTLGTPARALRRSGG
jgi:hypothetical protein